MSKTEQQRLKELAEKTADTVALAPISDIKKSVQVVLSALQEALSGAECEKCREKDEILKLLTYSYRVNGGLKESIDGALSAGSDIDVPISGGLIKQAFEVLATESRPTKQSEVQFRVGPHPDEPG